MGKRPFDDRQPIQGAYTLGQIAAIAERAGETMIEVACRRCERRGRLSLAKMMAEHGPDKTGPELLRDLAQDCPKLDSHSVYDRCGIHMPQMPLWVGIPDLPAK